MWAPILIRSTSGIDEETVPKTAALPISVQSAILWCSANFTNVVQSSGLHLQTQPRRPNHILSLSSSTAEHSVDNRKTVERHHAEGPFYPNAGWLRQMSGGLKIRRGWRATNSSDLFCGINVTATCESSKLDTSGQLRHAAPIFQSSRSVRVMHTAV